MKTKEEIIEQRKMLLVTEKINSESFSCEGCDLFNTQIQQCMISDLGKRQTECVMNHSIWKVVRK